MKTILTIILAAVLLLSMLGGCAKDMSGETRPSPAATSTARPTASAKPTPAAKATSAPTPAATDSTVDGIIDEGKDAVDGVVGAGEDAVNDIVDAGEDIVDDLTGADSTAKPAATSKP